MNTKRQYSLPNCNLILEGLEDADSERVNILDGQPPMSILINAECNFLNSNQKLSGGSVFLENLSRAVSNYAQQMLSGLSKPQQNTTEYPRISLVKDNERHLHRLTFEPEPSSLETKTEIDLTTVELFDLVDAIDQFCVDQTVLPDMTLELQSVSKRYRQPEQSLSERLVPVVVGLTSLAMAAGVFFVIPPPEIPQPESTPVTPVNTAPEEERETEPNLTEEAPQTTEPEPEDN